MTLQKAQSPAVPAIRLYISREQEVDIVCQTEAIRISTANPLIIDYVCSKKKHNNLPALLSSVISYWAESIILLEISTKKKCNTTKSLRASKQVSSTVANPAAARSGNLEGVVQFLSLSWITHCFPPSAKSPRIPWLSVRKRTMVSQCCRPGIGRGSLMESIFPNSRCLSQSVPDPYRDSKWKGQTVQVHEHLSAPLRFLLDGGDFFFFFSWGRMNKRNIDMKYVY